MDVPIEARRRQHAADNLNNLTWSAFENFANARFGNWISRALDVLRSWLPDSRQYDLLLAGR